MASLEFDRGVYEGEITAQRFGKTEPKDKEKQPTNFFQLDVKIDKVVDPVSGKTMDTDKPKFRTVTIYLTESTVDAYAFDHLEALGWVGPSLSELDPTSPQFKTNLVNVRKRFYCNHKKNIKNEMQENWSVQTSRNVERPESIKGAGASLDALFGNKARIRRASNPVTGAGETKKTEFTKPTGDDASF